VSKCDTDCSMIVTMLQSYYVDTALFFSFILPTAPVRRPLIGEKEICSQTALSFMRSIFEISLYPTVSYT